MTHKELLEEFLVFEDDNKLFELRIGDMPLWEYLRFDIFQFLKNELVSVKQNTGAKRMDKLKRIFVNYALNSVFKNPFKIAKNIDLLIFNHSRRRELDGVYKDIHTDPFLPDLNVNYAVIESIYNWSHLKPATTSNLYYFDVIEIPGFFKRVLSSKEPVREDMHTIDHLLFMIEEQWGIKVDYYKPLILKLIRQYKYTYKKVEKLLQKIRPKRILNVVSYAYNNQIVTEVAHKLNIEVIEVQHGIAGPLHIGYNYKGSPALQTVPDYFLAWGKYWVEETRMAIPQSNIKIVGFPYLDGFRQDNTVNINDKQVVFLSQMSQELGRFAEDFAVKMPDHQVVFKAHPTEYPVVLEKYAYLKDHHNIKIIADDKKPLYELFQESTVVFGINSTALIEALGFCSTIFVVKLAGWEYFENLAHIENFHFIDTVEQATALMKREISEKTAVDLSDFFAYDAKQKTCEFLENK